VDQIQQLKIKFKKLTEFIQKKGGVDALNMLPDEENFSSKTVLPNDLKDCMRFNWNAEGI